MNISQKDEFRYHFAGMAMQAMITAMWSSEEVQDQVFSEAKRHGFNSIIDYIAGQAADYADALVKELDSRDKL